MATRSRKRDRGASSRILRRAGLETIIAARKAHPAGKIIAISGGSRGATGSGADYLQQARLLGANATLGKPFSTADLFRTVEQTLHAA